MCEYVGWSTSNVHHPFTYSKAYFHHQFSVPFLRWDFFPLLLLSHWKFQRSSSVSLFTWRILPLCREKKKRHIPMPHKHTHAKPLDNMNRCTHATFFVYGNKWKSEKRAKAHRLYAINVNKIKLNLFVYCWVHFTVCLFVLVKEKQKQKTNVSARVCLCMRSCLVWSVYFRCHHTILH